MHKSAQFPQLYNLTTEGCKVTWKGRTSTTLNLSPLYLEETANYQI